MMAAKTKAQGTPRLRLSADFLDTLQQDFEKHREEVIEALRKESPRAYAELVARLIQTTDAPKENSLANANSLREIGERLLHSIGLSEPTEEQIDEATILNNNFLTKLEEIAGNPKRVN